MIRKIGENSSDYGVSVVVGYPSGAVLVFEGCNHYGRPRRNNYWCAGGIVSTKPRVLPWANAQFHALRSTKGQCLSVCSTT